LPIDELSDCAKIIISCIYYHFIFPKESAVIMKKFISTLLLSAMLLQLAACNASDEIETETETTAE